MSISLPGDDQSVQKFLDHLIEDIHIPDDEFAVDKPEIDEEGMETDAPRKPADGQEFSPVEHEDELMDIPEIASTSDRKAKSLRRVSIGNKAVGEMDQYLGGYGEDYGSRSSTTDLKQEGLRYYKEREIKKSLAARDKGKHSRDGGANQAKEEEAALMPSKHKSRRLLNFSKFTRKNKKTAQVVEPDEVASFQPHDDTSPLPAAVIPQIVVETIHVNGERDSIAVNTSLGGTDSDDTMIDETGKGRVHLPLESESVSDQVRRLQQSVKEHHPDDIIAEVRTIQSFLYMHNIGPPCIHPF